MKERLRARGPMTVAAYMEACNRHYYATRDPLGAAGDFTTAPEISQMFGEMIGACLVDWWQRAGSPGDAVYAELGPGRGTLAADALRVMKGAGLGGAAHLVETSPRLRAEQRSRLPDAVWHERIADLPPVPLLLVANEFFDALPVEQWIGDEERLVTIAGDDLAFVQNGMVVERSPARAAAAHALAAHLARHGGAALIIDYGHARSGAGDTLQAVKAHDVADPLANPGEQDLTAHVDFEALAAAARAAGVVTSAVTDQGEFLHALGIAARASALAARNPERGEDVHGALQRLTGGDAMGTLFKVIALHHPHWPLPAGLTS